MKKKLEIRNCLPAGKAGKLIFLLSTFYFLLSTSLAQDTLDAFIEEKLENLAESSQNEEEDYTFLLEALERYKKHPLNLNTANTIELSDLGLLDEIQIENLLDHIEKNGKLISVYELQSIDGFSLPVIEKILPYITVADISENPHVTVNEIIKQGTHQFIFRAQQVLEEQAGFTPIDSSSLYQSPNSRYIGSPQKIYARYRFTFNTNVSAGITAEKDAGELFFKQNQRFNYAFYDSLLNGKQPRVLGVDFYSAHFLLRDIRFVKALAIGDYQIAFGQGLTAWSGLSYGKTSDAVSIKRNAWGIRPHTSVDENLYLRGAALSLGRKAFQVTGFFSRHKIDANISSTDTLYTQEEVSSLQTSGLHTIPSEIADKDAMTQTVFGGNISFNKRKFSIGATAIHNMYDLTLNPSFSLYDQFEFSGIHLTNLGTDYSFTLQNLNFFGEISTSDIEKFSNLSYLNGCIIALDPRLSLSLLHRNYKRNYYALLSNAFAEGSFPINEQGLYIGINVKPIRFVTLNAYYDHFIFPWLRYQVDAPSNGKDFLLQINYTPSKKFDTYIRLRQKDKFVNSNTPDESDSYQIDFIVPFKQANFRWQIAYQISHSVRLRNRIEYIMLDDQSKKEGEDGYVIYQDVIYKKLGSRISFTLRYALFDTPSYDSRIYAYETDIPGVYSIPSYYYKGSRTYLMINYDIARWMELWLRWSQTYYTDRSNISPGSLTEIQGNTKSEVKFQIRIKLSRQ